MPCAASDAAAHRGYCLRVRVGIIIYHFRRIVKNFTYYGAGTCDFRYPRTRKCASDVR